MWKIIHKDANWIFGDLDHALKFAKSISEFVTITDGVTEIVGRFGVDAIENKVLPDGNSYDWTMRRGENKSWRKKNVGV